MLVGADALVRPRRASSAASPRGRTGASAPTRVAILPRAMPIPLLDLKQQYRTIKDDVLRVTEEVYESQAFILGKKVEAFEKDFAAYCSAKYAVGVSSGTDALLIALMVHGIGPGDDVIVPAYSF